MVASALIREGRVRRAFLGISGAVTPIGRPLAQSLGLVAVSGIRVLDVERASPADRAGIRRSDILVALDGATLASLTDLQRALSVERIDRPSLVTLVRRGERLALTLTPTESR